MPLAREIPRFSVPGHCIMFPGRRRDERGFYMFDTVIDGPGGDIQIGVSGEALRTIVARHGRQFRLAWLEDVERAEDARDAALAEAAELRTQVEALEAFKEHISGVAAGGFDIKRKQGRPAKKED